MRKYWKRYGTISIPITNDVKEFIKMKKELQKPYLTKYSLLLVQDLWQAHYQVLLII